MVEGTSFKFDSSENSFWALKKYCAKAMDVLAKMQALKIPLPTGASR